MDPDNNDIEMSATSGASDTAVPTTTTTTTTAAASDAVAVAAAAASAVISTDAKADSTELPREMSLDPAPEAQPSSGPMPPLKEQIKTIKTLLDAFAESPITPGDIGYIVSRSWLDKALELDNPKLNPEDLQPLGPVDNADIIKAVHTLSDNTKFVELKMAMGLESFEIFPADAWQCIMDWYGLKEGQIPIIRSVVDNNAGSSNSANRSDSVQFEFHPPVFEIHRVYSPSCPIKPAQDKDAKPLIITRSTSISFQQLLRDVKGLLEIPISCKIKFLQVTRAEPFSVEPASDTALTPPDSPVATTAAALSTTDLSPTLEWPTLLVSPQIYKKSQTSSLSVDHTGNPNYNGKSTVGTFGINGYNIYVVEEQISGDVFVSGFAARESNMKPKTLRIVDTSPKSAATSGKSSPTVAGSSTRSRTKLITKKRHNGAVGLSNLGNTCYMNSALQCVRSVEELSKYFLSEEYSQEINYNNPLAYNGRMANAYGELLKQMYLGNNDAVRPSNFKSTVGHCRPSFAGYAQHDSQEFLGFLLDALQEDLSRVKSKPYIEKPDSTDEMINDPEAIAKMAEEVWDITRRRDDSVIADLFTGLYKSTLHCPVCKKVSITFDPFNNLTLPLPVDTAWTRKIKFFPLNDVPVAIDVEIPPHSSVAGLKNFISERTGVSSERIMAGEEYHGKFFKFYKDTDDVSEIQPSDEAVFHEIEFEPTNLVQESHKFKYRSMLNTDPPEEVSFDDPKYDRLLVPVIHRVPTSLSASNKDAEAIPPHFISLTREEAYDEDTIRRKVLEKVATFSTWSTLHEFVTPIDGDQSSSAFDDSASSSGSKVVAKSIESEDDMVDVTMGGTEQDQPKEKAPEVPAKEYPNKLKQFNTKRPQWVDLNNLLDPILQSLFDLSYFRDSSHGSMPCGWGSVDDGKVFPRISDRVRADSPVSDTSDATGSECTTGNGTGTEEESSSESHTSPVTRMASESDGETGEMDPKAMRKSAGNKKAMRAGKKGKGRPRKQPRVVGKNAKKMLSKHENVTPPPSADNGPLIRFTEGLLVDWKETAWDMVFGQRGKSNNDTQGAKTFVKVENLSDPALEKKRGMRQSRKSRGISLYECLEEFEKAEVLSEQDMWYCPRCKEHRRASKKFDLWKTPDILICHLKRFSSSGWRRDKLDHKVDFPLEGLDLERHVLHKDTGKKEIYDLIAIDEHYGGLGGGHYTATAKNFIDGNWYNFNDSSVSRVRDPTGLSSSAAYLLFYRRRSSGALGGARFQNIFKNFDADESSDSSDDDNTNSRGVSVNVINSIIRQVPKPAKPADDAAYTSFSEPVHTSIEDEVPDNTGVQVALETGWSFNALGSSPADMSTLKNTQPMPGYPSDDADQGGDSDAGSMKANGSVDSYETPDVDDAFHDSPPASDATAVDLTSHVFGGDDDVDAPVTEIRLENNDEQ